MRELKEYLWCELTKWEEVFVKFDRGPRFKRLVLKNPFSVLMKKIKVRRLERRGWNHERAISKGTANAEVGSD